MNNRTSAVDIVTGILPAKSFTTVVPGRVSLNSRPRRQSTNVVSAEELRSQSQGRKATLEADRRYVYPLFSDGR